MGKFSPDRMFLPAAALPQPLPGWEYHVHTTYSDGTASLVEMTERAMELGLTRLVFTEHTEEDITSGSGWFGRYLAEARLVRAELAGRLELWAGLEAPAVDLQGGLLLDPEMAAEAEFILGAVHAYPGHGWELKGLEPERAIELEYQSLLGLLDNPLVDALAHPGGVCERFVTHFPIDRFEAVVIKAAARGVAIELNPAYLDDIAPYLALCVRHQAYLSPGSNVHHLSQLGRAWRALTALAG